GSLKPSHEMLPAKPLRTASPLNNRSEREQPAATEMRIRLSFLRFLCSLPFDSRLDGNSDRGAPQDDARETLLCERTGPPQQRRRRAFDAPTEPDYALPLHPERWQSG